MFTAIIRDYYQFLKRSCHTLEHDITQPYHKYTDLLFKLAGLVFGISGTYLLVTSISCYFVPEGPTIPAYCAPVFESMKTMREDASLFQVTLMRFLLGGGYMLVALFISLILVVRHLNETLPDHIYLRCFATEEEKRKRLPVGTKHRSSRT